MNKVASFLPSRVDKSDDETELYSVMDQERRGLTIKEVQQDARFSLVGLVPVDYLAVVCPSQSL